MKLARLVALLLVLPALAGCGGEDRDGTATLLVTRDRGAELLHDERVDAGRTVLRALREVADVETRYGGRYVQSIDGTAGSLAQRRDWFYFVNTSLDTNSAVTVAASLRVMPIKALDLRVGIICDEKTGAKMYSMLGRVVLKNGNGDQVRA